MLSSVKNVANTYNKTHTKIFTLSHTTISSSNAPHSFTNTPTLPAAAVQTSTATPATNVTTNDIAFEMALSNGAFIDNVSFDPGSTVNLKRDTSKGDLYVDKMN